MTIQSVAYRNREIFAPQRVEIEERTDGSLILQSPIVLNDFDRSVCDYVPVWAREAPDRIFLAERTASGEWRSLSYAEAWAATRSIGEALLAMGAAPGDRIAILSGNSVDHALMMLASMAIGCCVCPISPNYSLLVGGMSRLTDIGRILKPSFVFASQSGRSLITARVIPEFASARWITRDESDRATPIARLLATTPGQRFEQAFGALKPEMLAKILFTSGSTGPPKGVMITHRMLVSAVEMSGQLIEPPEIPVQVEWLPWHHTMGGNAIFNSILKNGGTHYIDDGRPLPNEFQRTLANLQEISPTSMLNVPAGYVMLVDALERDPKLRAKFFRNMRHLTYGGAALSKATISQLQALAVETIGVRIPILSGYGATEASPPICITHWPTERTGELGLPVPGLKVKLVPTDGRYELRIKGPNVTPGYYARPELNIVSFDDEGYYKVGDVVTFVNASRPEQGLLFAGRLSESFKLNSGTWVVPDEIRRSLIKAAGAALQDIVVAGENRDSIAVLVWPSLAGAAKHVSDPASLKEPAALARDSGLIGYLQEALSAHNRESGLGSRVSTFALVTEPPCFESGEVTDKGNVNQRAALKHRAQLVESLYQRPVPAGVFELD